MNFVTHFQMIFAPLSSSTPVELYFTFFAFIIRSHYDSAGITHNYEDWVKARLCKFHPETSPEFRDLRSTDLFHIGHYYCILRRPLITNLIPSTLFFSVFFFLFGCCCYSVLNEQEKSSNSQRVVDGAREWRNVEFKDFSFVAQIIQCWDLAEESSLS